MPATASYAQRAASEPAIDNVQIYSRGGTATQRQAQRQITTLELNNVTVADALRAIAKQADMYLFSNWTETPLTKRVSVKFDKTPLHKALETLMAGTGASAQIASSGEGIIIVRNGEKPTAQDSVGILIGRIVDSVSGKGLPGATVTIVGIKISTVTSDKGSFTIRNVPVGEHTVVVKILGYRTVSQHVSIVASKPANIQLRLASTPTELSGVVTTATGEQRRIEVGNDITVIRVDSVMRNMPVSSFTDLLATRVPGLYAAPTSGAPGAPTKIRIRGVKSLNGSNDPIVIVDGVQVYAVQRGTDGEVGSSDRSVNLVANSSFVPSPLDQIDPNSIETVEVLKGPSAVALYGSDAANGVIVVTTKRGQAGPTRWDMSASWDSQTIPGTWPTNYWAWGHFFYDETGAMHCTQPNRKPSGCIADSLVTYQILNDPATTVFGRGLAQTYRAGVSGGTSVVTYALNGSVRSVLGLVKLPDADIRLLQNEGKIIPDWQRRPQSDEQQSGSAKVVVKPNVSTTVSFTTILDRRFTATTPLDQAISKAISFDLKADVLGIDGQPLPRGSGLLPSIPDFQKRITTRSLHSTNALDLLMHLPRSVTGQVTAGVDITNRTDVASFGKGECYAITTDCTNDGLYNTGVGSSLQTNAKVRLSMPTNFGRFASLQTSVGGDLLRVTTNDVIRTAIGLPVGATSGNGGAIIGGRELSGDRITAGVYVGTTVGIANRYYIPFEIRKDAGSALGSKSSPTFPRLSLSYIVSDQPGFHQVPGLSILSTLRIRGAYGQAGKQPAVGAALRTYLQESTVLDGISTTIVRLAGFGNSLLKPERSREYEGGFDADLFDTRVNLGVTWTRASTIDLLVAEQLPTSVGGGGSQQINLGDVRNTGFEASIGATILQLPSVVWRSDVNLTVQRNELVRLGANAQSVAGGGGGVGMTSVGVHRVGYPLYSAFANPIIGYADRNHDGRITSDEILLGDSAVFVGAPYPKFTSNFQESMTLLGRITVGATFQYQDGLTQQRPGLPLINRRAYNDPNASLNEQAYLLNGAGSSGMQTVSTLRFSALSIGVMLPQHLTRSVLRSRTVNVALQGQNLGLWTNYRGKDPNVSSSLSEGPRDGGALPTPRSWGLTVRIN